MMRLASEVMHRNGDIVYISRYDVINAFLKTEEEENEAMAKELNVLLNVFCSAERDEAKSVDILPFNAKAHQKAISYISELQFES